MSLDIQFTKTVIAKSSMNIPGAGPESHREEPCMVLPLTNEEQFDEDEAALKEETVRRMMVNQFLTNYSLTFIVRNCKCGGIKGIVPIF